MQADAIDRGEFDETGDGLTTPHLGNERGDGPRPSLAAEPLTPDPRQTPSPRPADQDEPDPVATRALARAVARLLWEWAQAGRPALAEVTGPRRADE